MSSPNRILIVRLSHLGDVVHALGVFHALRAAFPGAEIAWAIQPEFAELVAGLPGLARVIRFERRGGPRAWLHLARELRAFRPEWCVDAQGNTKSGVAAWLSRAPRRTAPARADWQEPWAAWSANDRAPALVPPRRHAMDRMQALARHLVAETPLPLRTDVALTPEEERRGEQDLEERLPAGSGAGVLLHLSSPGDVRSWPAARWIELGRALRARGTAALFLSGPAEATLGAEVARALGPGAGLGHWIGQRGLRALAALFARAARRGHALVACDSGPMHLAAAHGLRVIALEGPQEAGRTGPWPPPAAARAAQAHAVVRSREAPACAPCLRRSCSHAEGPVCMRAIEAADVLAALDGPRGSPPHGRGG